MINMNTEALTSSKADEVDTMTLPEQATRRICDATLALIFLPELSNLGRSPAHVRSAFIVETKSGKWLLVTAAHVARQVEDFEAAGLSCRVSIERLGVKDPQPFYLPASRAFSFEHSVAELQDQSLNVIVESKLFDMAFGIYPLSRSTH